MAEFTFDGWDACEPSYSQFPIYLSNLQSQVAVGTFVEFATKVYRIVSHEDGLTMWLNYFQPFEDAALPHPCISVGNGRYVRELVQTTTGLNVQNSDQFRVVFLHTEEYITNGEYILGDGVEVVFVLRFQGAGASITCPPFPDDSPEYPLKESSYAREVFVDLCVIAQQLACLLNRAAESQGDYTVGRGKCSIH